MYQIRFSKSALKAMIKAPKHIAKRIYDEVKIIAASPSAYRGDWKPLQGSDFWRLRVGDWRVICEVESGELVILVLKVGPRGDIYK